MLNLIYLNFQKVFGDGFSQLHIFFIIQNFDILPANPMAHTCAKGFQNSLFNCKPGSKMFRWISFFSTVFYLMYCENFFLKTVGKTLNSLFDASYFYNIYAGTINHLLVLNGEDKLV